MFRIHYHDHLDHCYVLEEFSNYDDAYQFFKGCLAAPVEIYGYAYELTVEDDGESETLEFEEVQSLEQCQAREEREKA